MWKFGKLLILFAIAGCATAVSGPAPQRAEAGRSAQLQLSQGWVTPKVNQWFVPNTPETLTADELKKLNIPAVGFGDPR